MYGGGHAFDIGVDIYIQVVDNIIHPLSDWVYKIEQVFNCTKIYIYIS